MRYLRENQSSAGWIDSLPAGEHKQATSSTFWLPVGKTASDMSGWSKLYLHH